MDALCPQIDLKMQIIYEIAIYPISQTRSTKLFANYSKANIDKLVQVLRASTWSVETHVWNDLVPAVGYLLNSA